MTKETTHVRIDREVKALLEAQAGPGESVNDVIRRLVTGGPVPVNEQVNREVNSSPADLEELVNKAVNHKLTALEERLDTLNKIIDHLTTQCPQVDERVAPVTNNVISEKSLATKASESTPTDQYRITLTDDMKIQLADRVRKMMDSGKHYPEISTMTGVSESQLKKMKNNAIGKTILKSEYDSVMSL